MEKSVYLKMDSRMKEISFVVDKNKSDWISLRMALYSASKIDKDLQTRMEKSRIIFQKKN